MELKEHTLDGINVSCLEKHLNPIAFYYLPVRHQLRLTLEKEVEKLERIES